jgi:hypothetical protein
MSSNRQLNGPDFLMLGFDHELRRHGYAGNTCQMVLELGGTLSPETLTRRLAEVTAQHPILNARPGGWLWPHWKILVTPKPPQVRLHRGVVTARQLFNDPLDARRGELMRFDLCERAGGGQALTFTWLHALMDAPGAEHFLALVGHENSVLSAATAAHPPAKPPLRARLKLAWKYLHHLDTLCQTAPKSIGIRHPAAPAELLHRVETFDATETARIRANATQLAGLLGDAQYHAATALCELHRLRARLGCPSPSYVLPLAVGLRAKGSVHPVFSNELTMLMLQLLPPQLDSTATAIAVLKQQLESAMRGGLIESGRQLGLLFRFLPIPLYMAMAKQGLRGEICSLFFGDTAAVNPRLDTFLGVPVQDFTHVAAITPSPGLGVIFYYVRGLLKLTVVHSARVFTEAEAGEFTARLRQRLLQP